MVEGKTVVGPSLREALANGDCKTFKEAQALKDNEKVADKLVEAFRNVDSDRVSDTLKKVEGDKLAETMLEVEADTLG